MTLVFSSPDNPDFVVLRASLRASLLACAARMAVPAEVGAEVLDETLRVLENRLRGHAMDAETFTARARAAFFRRVRAAKQTHLAAEYAGGAPPGLSLLAAESSRPYRDLTQDDRNAFLGALRHQLRGAAYRHAGNWADAEEDLQETLEAIDRDGKKGAETFALVLKSWKTLARKRIDRARRAVTIKRGAGQVRSLDVMAGSRRGGATVLDTSSDPTAMAERQELLDLLDAVMVHILNEDERRYLAMHLAGFTNGEIGEAHGVNGEAMKKRVQAAKGKLAAAAPSLAPFFAAYVEGTP